MYSLNPAFRMLPNAVPFFIPVPHYARQMPICYPVYHSVPPVPQPNRVKHPSPPPSPDLQKAIDGLMWLKTHKTHKTHQTHNTQKSKYTNRHNQENGHEYGHEGHDSQTKRPAREPEKLHKILTRWKTEKLMKRKFWRTTPVKPNEWRAVRTMIRSVLQRYPNYRQLPDFGSKWTFYLSGLIETCQRFHISQRKLRTLTKIALGYRRSHTEDCIDQPQNVYRYYGFEEARAKRLVFPSVRKMLADAK